MDDMYLYCKQTLINRLNDKFYKLASLNEIATLPDDLENETKETLKFLILHCPYYFFENFDQYSKFNDYLVLPGLKFSVQFVSNLNDVEELIISIRSSFSENEKIKMFSVNISGYGKYKKVKLYISNLLKLNKENLLSIIKNIFEVAYEWFGVKIEDFVSKKTVSVAHKVYAYIKQILCNDKLFRLFWIAVVGKGYGFRLVNSEQVNQLYNTFSSNNNGEFSVNYYVSNLVSTRLPYDDLLMKAALDYNQTINGDISHAKYTQKGNVYSNTMYSLYGGNAFSIYPLVQGEIGIVALFPVECKEIIEKQLDYSKDEIVKIINNELSQIELAYLLFDDNYKENFSTGISLKLLDASGAKIILNKAFQLINEYYNVYKIFGENFICESEEQHNQKDIICLNLLESNGFVKREKNGFCITERGIVFIEKNRKEVSPMSINNSIINYGNIEEATINNRELQNISEFSSCIDSIKKTTQNTDEHEYVTSLLSLLEKEINKKQPKKNLIKTILSNLSSISSIASLVNNLKSLINF